MSNHVVIRGVAPSGERVIMDTDTAVIYEVGLNDKPSVVCPVMPNDHKSSDLAWQWAHCLAKISESPVTIWRNGAKVITLPAQK